MKISPELLGQTIATVIRDTVRPDALRGPTAQPEAVRHAKFSLATITKFVGSSGKRTIRGFASTSAIDRHGDIVDPAGGQWQLPLPLLWSHDAKQPIGYVRTAEATSAGVRIEAEIVEGVARADEVWRLIEAGALDSFSVGFIGRKGEPLQGGGTRWTEWELVEVSVVAIPSNRGAKIGKGGVKLLSGSVKLVGEKQ